MSRQSTDASDVIMIIMTMIFNFNTNNVDDDVQVHLSRQSTDASDVLMIIMTLILQFMLVMMFKFICLDRAQMLVMCAGANLTFSDK